MKHRTSNQIAALALLAASGALYVRPALACGGFFCSQAQPVNQAAERIIFADNGDGTITAVIQILYDGPSESFSWLLPIGSVPEGDELGVASDIAFQRLQFATNPQFNLTTVVEGSCRQSRGDSLVVPAESDDSPSAAGGAGGASNGVNVEASGVVGAFDWVVISVDDASPDPALPATDWLTQNGYDVPPGGADLIRPYLADNMYLLALRLTKGSDVGSIRPIRLTYRADAPSIPIKLTAVAANQDMGVMTWALSGSRAVPFNYNALELNEARINWFNASANYNDVVIEAADDAGGQGFVTEFAGPSSQLANVVWSESDESEWDVARIPVYRNRGELLAALVSRYQGYSGFWDALRRTITLPEAVSFDDFKACPQCYADDADFAPTELYDAIDADVLEPVRSVQALIDRMPYATRLYSTLSAAEMTLDPVFVFNPDLPAVDNIHRANRVIECSPNLYTSEAPWRIDFPQGASIRGTADQVGLWPDAVNAQPPNTRVLMLAASGEGAVVDDNASLISSMLSDYNATVPTPKGSGAGDSADGGFCDLSRPVGSGSRSAAPAWLALALGVLLQRARAARRAR
ncbi:MAG TPA: DUF2330 domain-containing protein [Polyangiaceae bacterium]|nr:DUF2330 domain-containing protein [Polyangiaceae bacterium]